MECVCLEDTQHRGLHQSPLQHHRRGPLHVDLRTHWSAAKRGAQKERPRKREREREGGGKKIAGVLPHHRRNIDRLITVALQAVINTTGMMEAGWDGGGRWWWPSAHCSTPSSSSPILCCLINRTCYIVKVRSLSLFKSALMVPCNMIVVPQQILYLVEKTRPFFPPSSVQSVPTATLIRSGRSFVLLKRAERCAMK